MAGAAASECVVQEARPKIGFERTSDAYKIVFGVAGVALRPNPNAGGFAALVTQVALRVGCMLF